VVRDTAGHAGYAADAGYRGYASDDVVTGEGVAVELPVATVIARAGSGILDLLVAALLLLVATIGLQLLAGRASEAVGTALVILVVVGITVGVPATVETLTRGRTLGKLALGLRVVRDDGGPITARHAITRALVGWVEIYLLSGAPALISALIHPRAKRLGDMAAGTYVVNQRAQMRLLPPPMMPPPLQRWAASADLATLPPGLAIAIRQFLGRAPSLTPQSRHQLGHELLVATLPHVSPPPPPGFHPEYVLAAVIADRRRRDLDRLWREEQRRRAILPPDPWGSGR
jgi:uncharacterized RDD family membrane protein YckC